jgi:hypothetical protein
VRDDEKKGVCALGEERWHLLGGISGVSDPEKGFYLNHFNLAAC